MSSHRDDPERMQAVVEHCKSRGFVRCDVYTDDYRLGDLVLRTISDGTWWCFRDAPGLIDNPTADQIDTLISLGVHQ